MAYRIREVSLPLLPPGRPALRILHFSDIHLVPRQRKSIDFIKSWRKLDVDMVISTGDHIASPESIFSLQEALGPLLEKPGFFVFGSNDYYGPRFKNPMRYLLPDNGKRNHGSELPWKDLEKSLSSLGWVNTTHKITRTTVSGTTLEVRGTDDAHLNRDDYMQVSGTRGNVDLSIGITHAPYARLLSAMADDKVDLIFAGHTHGGQIRIPWFGGTQSLTTNCDLPRWRSRGITRVEEKPWLHVSAGMGHNPMLPFRLFSPKEASVLTLISHS
jgi:predicted MPP superfamily phosphohydrolase